MKCQSCGKKEATVRYFENINGDKQELHLCSDCAQNLGFTSFSNIFSPLFASLQGYNLIEKPETCEHCGYDFKDYLDTGYFGCPKCYESFEDKLDDLFMKLQGKSRHITSSKPKKHLLKKLKDEKNEKSDVKENNDVGDLKRQLADLVKQERYEEAAVLRDKIKDLEGK